MLIEYLKVFAVGGALCAIGQQLIDKTKLTPARILTVYVVLGLILEAVGLYSPLVKWAGAGATVPLTGFGSTLAKGVEKAVSESGVLGAFTGGFTAAAAGICAAVFFGIIIALLFKPRDYFIVKIFFVFRIVFCDQNSSLKMRNTPFPYSLVLALFEFGENTFDVL